MARSWKKITPHLIPILFIVLLGFLLYWRVEVGLTRFFDVDEFSYLHWVANFVQGYRPYVDYFMFFTPGFLWFMAPLFVFIPPGGAIFIAARVVSFLIFTGILAGLGSLFSLLRGRKWALIPVILLAFLPMPYDKFLETRPDNMATLFALWGLVFQVAGMLHSWKGTKKIFLFSGLCYALSLVVFAKTVPFVLVGVLMAIWELRGIRTVRDIKQSEYLWFFAGLAAPFIVMGLYLLSLGNPAVVWYSLTKLPFEANMIGKFSVMEPHLFFFPNGSFYGGRGITLGYMLNHAIWTIGILVGVTRLLTPYITSHGDKRKTLAELLVGGIFILSVFGYIQFFPLKHSQYLIPIAIFIAFYAADLFAGLLDKLFRRFGALAVLIVILVSSYGIVCSTIEINRIKIDMSNTVQLEQVKSLRQMIPATSAVLDLDGRMIFWNDAYYICCVPFGSFVPFLSVKPASVSHVLETGNVPYIFQGDTNRLYLLSTLDRQYIQDNYIPVPGWGESLWKRKE